MILVNIEKKIKENSEKSLKLCHLKNYTSPTLHRSFFFRLKTQNNRLKSLQHSFSIKIRNEKMTQKKNPQTVLPIELG